jgi:hypothetical protein
MDVRTTTESHGRGAPFITVAQGTSGRSPTAAPDHLAATTQGIGTALHAHSSVASVAFSFDKLLRGPARSPPPRLEASLLGSRLLLLVADHTLHDLLLLDQERTDDTLPNAKPTPDPPKHTSATVSGN